MRRVHSSAIWLRGQIGIPGQAAEAVEIGLREMIAEPVVVEADVGDADEALDRATLTGRLRCRSIEIESFFPHGDQKHRVASLADVLLRDLEFDGLVGFLERAEERRRGLAHLEIDGAVLDLDDDVVVELAVEATKLS